MCKAKLIKKKITAVTLMFVIFSLAAQSAFADEEYSFNKGETATYVIDVDNSNTTNLNGSAKTNKNVTNGSSGKVELTEHQKQVILRNQRITKLMEGKNLSYSAASILSKLLSNIKTINITDNFGGAYSLYTTSVDKSLIEQMAILGSGFEGKNASSILTPSSTADNEVKENLGEVCIGNFDFSYTPTTVNGLDINQILSRLQGQTDDMQTRFKTILNQINSNILYNGKDNEVDVTALTQVSIVSNQKNQTIYNNYDNKYKWQFYKVDEYGNQTGPMITDETSSDNWKTIKFGSAGKYKIVGYAHKLMSYGDKVTYKTQNLIYLTKTGTLLYSFGQSKAVSALYNTTEPTEAWVKKIDVTANITDDMLTDDNEFDTERIR